MLYLSTGGINIGHAKSFQRILNQKVKKKGFHLVVSNSVGYHTYELKNGTPASRSTNFVNHSYDGRHDDLLPINHNNYNFLRCDWCINCCILLLLICILVIAQRNRTVACNCTVHILLPVVIYSDYVFHIVFY